MTQVDGGGLPEGTQLNGIFEIERRIAIGGMGEVYIGRSIQTGDRVAIKMILPEHANNPTILDLFRREASTLHNLYNEAIVRYFVFSVDPVLDRPYLAMEFAEGPSLGDRLRERPLDEAELAVLRRRVSGGLHAAHGHGIVHRDISPDNIILVDGRVDKAKIIDFGIAKSAAREGTLIGSGFAGKLNYVSPEQLGLAGGEVTAKSDIYSLGLVFAEAATGRPLPMGGSHAEVIDKRRGVPDLGDVPAYIRPLIEQMVQPMPEDRPADMQAVAEWTPPAGVAATSTGPAQAAAAPAAHPRERRRPGGRQEAQRKRGLPWVWIGLGGAAAAAAAVVLLLGLADDTGQGAGEAPADLAAAPEQGLAPVAAPAPDETAAGATATAPGQAGAPTGADAPAATPRPAPAATGPAAAQSDATTAGAAPASADRASADPPTVAPQTAVPSAGTAPAEDAVSALSPGQTTATSLQSSSPAQPPAEVSGQTASTEPRQEPASAPEAGQSESLAERADTLPGPAIATVGPGELAAPVPGGDGSIAVRPSDGAPIAGPPGAPVLGGQAGAGALPVIPAGKDVPVTSNLAQTGPGKAPTELTGAAGDGSGAPALPSADAIPTIPRTGQPQRPAPAAPAGSDVVAVIPAPETLEPTAPATAPATATAAAPATSTTQPGATAAIPPAAPAAGQAGGTGDNTLGQVRDYILGYDGGDCFLSRPMQLGPQLARIEVFASEAQIQPVLDFDAAFKRDMGFEATIGMRPISEKQCGLIRGLDGIGAQALDNALLIDLDRDELRPGATLSGEIRGGEGARLYLFDDAGGLTDLSAFVKPQGGDGVFSVPISASGPQILIAWKPVRSTSVPAAASLDQLLDAARRGEAALALGFFVMQG